MKATPDSAPASVDSVMALVFAYGAARVDVDRSNGASPRRACDNAIAALRAEVERLAAQSDSPDVSALRDRCNTALQSLPDAQYRTMLAGLFDDLLAAQSAPTDRWHDAAMPPEIEQRLAPWLTNGAALHPATVNLVVRFARALLAQPAPPAPGGDAVRRFLQIIDDEPLPEATHRVQWVRQYRAALAEVRAALESALRVAMAPKAGFVMAPIEPTDAMVQATHHIDLSYMPTQWGADRAAVYRAMIAASQAGAAQEPKP